VQLRNTQKTTGPRGKAGACYDEVMFRGIGTATSLHRIMALVKPKKGGQHGISPLPKAGQAWQVASLRGLPLTDAP
jgi:hypothetical protein